jgi:antitoxin (DNA-binding transcriptional repressor) of toxin-antitoxin stability system
MPSMTLRQLRNTRQLKSLVKSGQTIELKDRNRTFARIVPIDPPPAAKEWPDFEARLKSIFGDQVLNVVDEFIKDRNRW